MRVSMRRDRRVLDDDPRDVVLVSYPDDALGSVVEDAGFRAATTPCPTILWRRDPATVKELARRRVPGPRTSCRGARAR